MKRERNAIVKNPKKNMKKMYINKKWKTKSLIRNGRTKRFIAGIVKKRDTRLKTVLNLNFNTIILEVMLFRFLKSFKIFLINCNLKLITLMMYLLLNSIKMGLCTLKDKANLFALPIFHYQSACNPLCTSYALYALKNIIGF